MTDATERRWRLYPLAVIAAVLLAVVISALTADGSDSVSGRLGGDFAEFYGAGRILADGDADDLYDPSRQAQAQADLLGDPDGTDATRGILFAYPAIVAAPYAALVELDFQVAYLVHTALMLAAAALALWLVAPRLPLLHDPRHRLAAAAYGLTFLPLFVGLTGGQNTALTLLAVAVVWWALQSGRPGWAGLAAGLLLVKPQYALTLLGLLVLARHWRALGGAVAGGAVVWAGSALVAGADWTRHWLDLATSIDDIDQGANLPNEVSWLGLAQIALGRESDVALALGIAGSVVTAVVLVACLRRRGRADALAVAVVLPSLLLIAPHALYYDAGILVVSIGVMACAVPAARRAWVLAVWWVAGFGHVLAGDLGVEPVAALVVLTWLWAVRQALRTPESAPWDAAQANPLSP